MPIGVASLRTSVQTLKCLQLAKFNGTSSESGRLVNREKANLRAFRILARVFWNEFDTPERESVTLSRSVSRDSLAAPLPRRRSLLQSADLAYDSHCHGSPLDRSKLQSSKSMICEKTCLLASRSRLASLSCLVLQFPWKSRVCRWHARRLCLASTVQLKISF